MKLQRKDTAIYIHVKDVRKFLKVMTNIFLKPSTSIFIWFF